MELREYQKKVTSRLSEYLLALVEQHHTYEKIIAAAPEAAGDFHFPARAWTYFSQVSYQKRFDGLEQPVPNVCYKVPTGGGKTLLACHSIDLINKVYLQKQAGLVLWIVPTTQIYRQTLGALRDRNHPYRQVLDVSSGGKTLILEKLSRFTPTDVAENLCIMLLMLPSAARQSKETLKIFKDNSGYSEFFPPEDAYKLQEQLIEHIPNLDTFGAEGYMWGNTPKTSLGNVLRILRPITIIDEGHRAYSQTARETIAGFNPSFLLELSATPPEAANKLVEITGKELNDEQMIKLDMHLVNKTTVGWKETVADAKGYLDSLEVKAREYEQNTDLYIRPIMLLQVERTGKDQRDGVLIHSEDVKEYLMKQAGVPEEQIAIKSSEKDDIEGIDLLSRDCPIRYIITKQALQEGWDCPFAYVLCSLTKSQSETAMTQLIGRVLRQPYARKTGIQELDECYIYSFQHDTTKLVRGIKQNLEGEGLGDLAGRIAVDSEDAENPDYVESRTINYREEFKTYAGKIYLPFFAINDGSGLREVRYATDILSRLDWSKANVASLSGLNLEDRIVDDIAIAVTIDADGKPQALKSSELSYESEIDTEYVARQIIDIVPNPWIAFETAQTALHGLLLAYDKEIVASNLVFIIESLRSLLFKERDRLAEIVFRSILKNGEMKFYLLSGQPLHKTGSLSVRSKRALTNEYTGGSLERSLFDYVPKEDMNNLEEAVALYLDAQKELIWWYRNMSKADYRIQGWRPGRIYPDFLAANDADDEFDKVYVLESKGGQLAGNEDTEYKRNVFELCNSTAIEKNWQELDLGQSEPGFHFEMLDEHSWKSQLNNLLKSEKRE